MQLSKFLKICGFREFPFDYKPSSVNHIWAGRDEVLDELLHIRDSVGIDGLSEFGIITGDHGSGKTHSLLHLKYLVDSWDKVNPKCLALYIENPTGLGTKGTFVEAYAYIVSIALGFEKIHGIFLSASNHILNKAKRRLAKLPKTERDELMGEPELHANRLGELQSEIYYELVGESPIVFDAFQRVAEFDKAAWQWLSGGLGRKQPSIKGVTVQSLTSHILCAKALSTIVMLATEEDEKKKPLSYSGVFILVDQTEDISRLPGGVFQEQIVGWRTLIDSVHKKLCVIWAQDGSAEDVEAMFTEALQRRQTVNPSKLALDPLEPKEALDFLEEIMQYFRDKKADVPSKQYPFSKESLEEIINHVIPMTTPSSLLTACRQVFVRVAQDNDSWDKNKRITKRIVTRYL